MKATYHLLIACGMLCIALVLWVAPAQAIGPGEADVIVTDVGTETNLTATTNMSTTTTEVGGSVTLQIQLDVALNFGSIAIRVFESDFEETFIRPSTGETLVGSQCSIRLQQSPERTTEANFSLTNTTPVLVVIEPYDDLFFESTPNDEHFCEITVTRLNSDSQVTEVVTVYTVDLNDTVDDSDRVNLLYKDRLADEEVPTIIETQQLEDNDGVFSRTTEILTIFTAPVDIQTQITFNANTPTVCAVGFEPPQLTPSAGQIGINSFYAIPIVLLDVKEATTCEIAISWEPVPPSYPTDYTPPPIRFTVRPTEDVNEDGIITPRDAMFVINRNGQVPTGDATPADVNADGNITASDAESVLEAIGNSAR